MEEFNKILSKISYENGLSKEECSFSFNYILEGKASDHQIELFLLGLRERGETVAVSYTHLTLPTILLV